MLLKGIMTCVIWSRVAGENLGLFAYSQDLQMTQRFSNWITSLFHTLGWRYILPLGALQGKREKSTIPFDLSLEIVKRQELKHFNFKKTR